MAGVLIILIFLVAFCLVIAAPFTACSSPYVPRSVSVMYIIAAVLAFGGGIWSTYYYDYYTNPNTHFHGWPIPHVVFQRDNSESEWRDYIGPTILLALPMNWIIFLLPPSLGILVTHLIRKKKNQGA